MCWSTACCRRSLCCAVMPRPVTRNTAVATVASGQERVQRAAEPARQPDLEQEQRREQGQRRDEHQDGVDGPGVVLVLGRVGQLVRVGVADLRGGRQQVEVHDVRRAAVVREGDGVRVSLGGARGQLVQRERCGGQVVVERDLVQHGLELRLGCRVGGSADGLPQVPVYLGDAAVHGRLGVALGGVEVAVPDGQDLARGLRVQVAEREVQVRSGLCERRRLPSDAVHTVLGVRYSNCPRYQCRNRENHDGTGPQLQPGWCSAFSCPPHGTTVGIHR